MCDSIIWHSMTVLSTNMRDWCYDKVDPTKSPSAMDGINKDQENRYRREGARFVIECGTKLGLRYDTMATGVVYFQRFYMFHSFKTFPRYITACCCLFLAGKVEETPKKCRDIIKIAKTLLNESQFAQFGDDPKEEVITLERILLQTIKFDLQVDHPYGYLLKYAKSLQGDEARLQAMVQMAWTFINDSLCTTLCLEWEPEVIAIALMHLAGKLTKFEVENWIGRIPKQNHWWDMFIEGATIDLLEDICHQVLDVYSTTTKDAPHESPPATPPTKTTIRKAQPVVIQPEEEPPPIADTVEAPAATSPVPAPKAKEVPVGQPIPRLEPGELKRKAKMPLRKDSTDKSSRASAPKKKRVSLGSPPTDEPENIAGESCALGDIAQPDGNSEGPSKTQHSSTETASSSSSNMQYLTGFNQSMPFDSNMSYFASDNQPSMSSAYIQNASYLLPQSAVAPPALPSVGTQSQPPPPPVVHPGTASYTEAYNSQSAPPPLPPSYQPPLPPPPPQIHVAPPPPPVPQYPPPPVQPPPMPAVLPPPPPMPSPNQSHMHLPPPMPPMPPTRMPPGLPPPRHFRPERGPYPPLDRMNSPTARGPMPRPPRFYHDRPPEFGMRGHFDDRPIPPHYRDMDYERERDERYPDDFRPPAFGHEFDNAPMPYRRYGHERGPLLPPHSPAPRMEAPTGIPPVRITGRY